MWLLLSVALAADVAWYEDFDADGFGDGGTVIIAPADDGPEGFVRNDGDCNDVSAAVSPNATEICNAVDDNCDGLVDSAGACPLGNFSHYGDHAYAVFNYDGNIDQVYRREWDEALVWCASAGWSLATIETPDEDEYLRDQVRAENANRTYWIGLTDLAQEGQFVWSDGSLSLYRNWARFQPDDFWGEDCTTINYLNGSSHWNDEECDADRPFVCEASGDPRLWWPDTDGDGYGDSSVDGVFSNGQPAGHVANRADCNDGSGAIAPGTPEVCNGLDDDCNGEIDDKAEDRIAAYVDADGDGFGAGEASRVCSLGDGQSARGDDCNDDNIAINPDADELCNGVDDNCSGAADEGAVDQGVFYVDGDGDGFGASETVRACQQPDGTATQAGDCDDSTDTTNPDALELCNGVDDNCNEAVDDDPFDGQLYYLDEDGDEYGQSGQFVVECDEPEGYTAEDGDCNDQDANTYPGAEELPDGLDNDCDGFPEDVDPDTDTDPDSDSDTDVDPDTTDPDTDGDSDVQSSRQFDPASSGPAPTGCSCSASGHGAPWGLLIPVLPLLATLRRSRQR